MIVHVRATVDKQRRRGEVAPRAANISAVSAPCGIIRLYSGRPCGGTAIICDQVLRARVEVGAVLDEQPHDLGMFLRDRPHQRGLSARATRVGLGALCEQQFSDPGALPARAAAISGVSPDNKREIRIAPASSSRSTIAALPLRLAAHNGVAPMSFAAFTFAPELKQTIDAGEIVAIGGPV